MKRSEYFPYLQTLRRVPDDVILSVATRDLNLDSPRQCVCGWVLREAFARMADKTADDVLLVADYSLDILNPLAEQYGGDVQEWSAIYWGVTGAVAPLIERAFVERVLEAVV